MNVPKKGVLHMGTQNVKTKKTQHTLLCYITPVLFEVIRKQAFAERLSVSAWTQRAIRAELEREQVTP